MLAGLIPLDLNPALASDDLPPAQLSQLLLRILAYDRNLAKRSGSTVRVGVVYRKDVPESEAAHAELKRALEASAQKVTISSLPVRITSIAYNTPETFEAQLDGISVLFVCAGLTDVIPEISKATRRHATLSFTSHEAHVEAGLSVALVRRGTKAAIVISLKGTRAEGVDLDAALLRLADVRT